MTMQGFTFEFLNEVQSLGPQVEEHLRTEAEQRLRKLQQGHTDLIGAAVSVEQPIHAETPFLFQARVVAYARPKNIAATTKESDAMRALKGALDAVERQVREQRARLRQQLR